MRVQDPEGMPLYEANHVDTVPLPLSARGFVAPFVLLERLES